MEIYDEWNPTEGHQVSSDTLLTILEKMKAKHEHDIQEIKDKIIQYEQKKKSEQAFYQSLSPVRKFFTGRAPNHHQAVEYMVHVKERLKKIANINQQILRLEQAFAELKKDPLPEKLFFPNHIFEEIMRMKQKEDQES